MATLADLLRSSPMILQTQDSPVRTGFNALCARLGIVPKLAAEVDKMAMIHLLPRDYIGLAVPPPIVVQYEFQSGILMESPHCVGLSERFHAVTVKRKFPNPLLATLLGGGPVLP